MAFYMLTAKYFFLQICVRNFLWFILFFFVKITKDFPVTRTYFKFGIDWEVLVTAQLWKEIVNNKKR